MGYYSDYVQLIERGIKNTVVTDYRGNELSLDQGMEQWARQAEIVKNTTKGLMFFCGNGASATMSEHMSHDWFQNAVINTTTCSETAHITAISNDIDYENVFSYRVRRILSERDLFIGISSSGNSTNIINAIKAARENRAYTISLTGKSDNNSLRQLGDLNFYIPLHNYGEVESAHALILHMALDYYMDTYMEGRH